MDYHSQFLRLAPKDQEHIVATNDAVIYTRVSSSDQEDNTSLASQKRYCEELAQRNGYRITEYFGATYESAKSDERKEFEKMLQYVKRNKNISYIIVYSYDRFSRTGISGAYIADGLMKDYNVRVISVTQMVDTKTAEGKMMQDINFIFGNYDNEQRKRKCTNGTREVLRKGYWPFSVPFGYKNLNPRTRAHEHQIVPDENAKWVRKMFEWKAQGVPSVKIRSNLKDKGIDLIDKTISKMLRNPFYCGIIFSRFTPNEVIEAKHPAIITKALFLRVNGLLNANNTRREHNLQEDENLPLRRFAICHNCGNPLTGYIVKAKGLYYYKCRTIGCKCNKSTKQLHNQFSELLERFQLQKKAVPVFEAIMKMKIEERNAFSVDDKPRIKRKITELDKKINTIEERFVLNEIPIELYQKYSTQYKDERNQLSASIEKSQINSSNLEKAICKTTELALNLQKSWAVGNYERKTRLQNIIFPEGISYDRKSDRVRTPRINSFFLPILDITRCQTKSNQLIDRFLTEDLPYVESEGFEP